MKSVISFAVFLLFVNLSHQVSVFVDCPAEYEATISTETCAIYTCDGLNGVYGLGCAPWRCSPGTQIGYKQQNNSATYPDCCPGPICKLP